MKNPPQEAVDRLEKAVTRSKRKSSVRLPLGFARDRNGKPADPPLAALLRGGGESRLKVLLVLVMITTKAPHTRKISSREIAEMLGYPEPGAAGSRRVNKAITDLTRMGLLRRHPDPGRVPVLEVLDPAGSGDAWDARALTAPYITLPIDLFRKGWFLALSGRALALYVILRELTQSRGSGGYADGIRKRQYGFSEDWWADAAKELRNAGLLTWKTEVKSVGGEPRQRNIYRLLPESLALDPADVIDNFDE